MAMSDYPARAELGADWPAWRPSHRSAEEGVDLDHKSFRWFEFAKDGVGDGILGEFEQIRIVEVGFARNGDDSGVCIEFPNGADHFTAVDTGHTHISYDQVRPPAAL